MIPSLVIGAFLWLTALGVIAGMAWEWWRDRQRHKAELRYVGQYQRAEKRKWTP